LVQREVEMRISISSTPIPPALTGTLPKCTENFCLTRIRLIAHLGREGWGSNLFQCSAYGKYKERE